MPGSSCSVHEISSGNTASDGAPQSGGNVNLHSPSTGHVTLRPEIVRRSSPFVRTAESSPVRQKSLDVCSMRIFSPSAASQVVTAWPGENTTKQLPYGASLNGSVEC